MWGNDFFFSQHSLPQCIVRMWFNNGHLWDFRILSGSDLNQGRFVSADSECQGPVRILREGGIGAEVRLSCEHRSFSWLIIFTSEFNLPFLLLLLFDPPSIDTMALKNEASFRPSRCIWCIQFWATLSWWGKLQCWDTDSLWSSQHAPFPLESLWCVSI